MSITAKFTSISSVPEKVVKSPSWPETGQTIEAWEQIDDLTCDFVLAGSGYHASNYMQVSWNGTVKYYFIESRSGLPGSRTRIRAVCDDNLRSHDPQRAGRAQSDFGRTNRNVKSVLER